MMRGLRLMIFLAAVLCLTLSNCATIVHGGKNQGQVKFFCTPGADECVVKNLYTNKEERHFGGAEITLYLERRYKFFKRFNYQVTFKKVGYDDQVLTLKPKVTIWYWLNIPAGVVGMITVDPATGAMYQYEKKGYNINFF